MTETRSSPLTRPFDFLSRSATWLAFHLLAGEPSLDLDAERRRAFEAAAEALLRSDGDESDGESGESDGTFAYDLPYPTWEFLAYLTQNHPVLLHGSNDPGIETFEPREQTDWRGTPQRAIFATADPHLATFFAIVDREGYDGSLRNGAFLVERPRGGVDRRYYFSLAREAADAWPFTGGTVYVLPAEPFEPPAVDRFGFDEWYGDRPVEPLGAIHVEPEAFRFVDRVALHDDAESVWKSLALYRWRRRWSRLEGP